MDDAPLEAEGVPDPVWALDADPVLALEPLLDHGSRPGLGGEAPQRLDHASGGLLRGGCDPAGRRNVERGAEERVIGGEQQMHGSAHQHPSKHRATPKRAFQRLATEAFEPGPEPDVGSRRPLGLHAGEPLDRPGHGQPRPSK